MLEPRKLETTPWRWLGTLGLGVVAAIVSQIPALAALALSSDYGLNLAKLQHAANDGVAVIVLVCVSTPVQVGLLLVFARRRDPSGLDYLGLRLPRRTDLALLVVAAAGLIAADFGFSWLLGTKVVTTFQGDIYRSAQLAGVLPWLWLTVVVVAPIGEETLFRGFLFRGWLGSPRNPWPAIVATSAAWALLHVQYNPFTIGEIFLVGLAFGWVRATTGSTVATMALHAFLNAAGLAETFFAVGG
jgi:membrane protease YdiL (CAAX protease family)